jgi:hypothetical protein
MRIGGGEEIAAIVQRVGGAIILFQSPRPTFQRFLNIRATEEFVVNLGPFSAVEKMGSPHDLFKIVRCLYQRMARPVCKWFF